MASSDSTRDAWGRIPGQLGCKHCEPDWLSVGRGWLEMDNNGPIVACPVCNPNELPDEEFEAREASNV